MSILKVARMGHPVLRAKAEKLSRSDVRSPEIQKLIDDMVDTMREYRGIGLAAPQVHESLRLFVAAIEGDDDEEDEDQLPLVAIVNPEIKPLGGETVEDWEGCLSIPEIRGEVRRPRRIRVRGLNREGDPLDLELEDYAARVVQHETDHLDGLLFIDRMQSLDTLTYLEEFTKYHAKHD